MNDTNDEAGKRSGDRIAARGDIRGTATGDEPGNEPAEQVAAESGEAHTLGHGISGGEDYTAVNPGGTSAES
ncbi:hypothetical protein [Humibacter sp.]|uniref:hypothetical protein n=1 Tax=Humibacter sp. TaxID=1940291 RepID=UPI003F7EADA1